MTDATAFAQYVEALTVLATVDDRRCAALRKAVEDAAATESQAKAAIADQQRMYVRAARDIDDAERALVELRSVGGFPSEPVPAAEPASHESPPSLATIRGTVAEVAMWVAETRPVLESLLRSRDRLARAQPQAPPVISRPQPQQRARWPVWAVGGTAVVVAIVIIALIVITQ